MRRLVAVLVATVLTASAATAAPPLSTAQGPARSDPAVGRAVAAADRAWIAANIYHAVERYFAHWSGLPAGYDFDARFRAYLAEALVAPDRRSFSLATMRLVAGLSNGHTAFTDETLYDDRPAPFYAEPLDGRWTVEVSRVADIVPGDVVVAVDGVPIEQWIGPIRAIIGQSSVRARDGLVFLRPFMLPERFVVTLSGGRSVAIDRGSPLAPRRGRPNLSVTTTTVRPDGTVVIAMPSFDDPAFETAAVAAVVAHADAGLIVFDLRGNGGGSTPHDLLKAVMTAPYAGTIVQTPLTVAEFDAHGSFDPADNALPAATIRYGPDVTAPVPAAFKGRVAIVVDRRCASACEDFAIRFKSGHRGPVIGEATWGSTGQPYKVDFGDGMSLRVSTKREFFADGSPFEGVGVVPDVPVPPRAGDFAAAGDPWLDRAVAAATAVRP